MHAAGVDPSIGALLADVRRLKSADSKTWTPHRWIRNVNTPQQDNGSSSSEVEGHSPSDGHPTGYQGSPFSLRASCSRPSSAVASQQNLGDQPQQSHRLHTQRRLQQWSNREGILSTAASLAGCSDKPSTLLILCLFCVFAVLCPMFFLVLCAHASVATCKASCCPPHARCQHVHTANSSC